MEIELSKEEVEELLNEIIPIALRFFLNSFKESP